MVLPKVITSERKGGIKYVTIEVSSFDSLSYYKQDFGELTTVRFSESCSREDRNLIKQACYGSFTMVYESDDGDEEEDEDDDDEDDDDEDDDDDDEDEEEEDDYRKA